VVELAGYYLGCYENKDKALEVNADLKATFEPLRVEQEAVEHAIEKCMFRQSANTLKDRSAALGRAIQKMEKRI
jgi:hypothetical protein